MSKQTAKNRRTFFHALYIVVLICGMMLLMGWGISYLTAEAPSEYYVERQELKKDYDQLFDDNQHTQLKAAHRVGITPVGHASDIKPLLESGELVEISGHKSYYLHDVSLPYLTPNAAGLLQEIGVRFQKEKGMKHSRLRVTSCLRTEASVNELMKNNPNSVKNSCHLYGTTFDISYARMSPTQKQALAQVLYDLQSARYCYVKYEQNMPCFHITVRR